MDDEAILCLYWARNEKAITETERKYRPYCGKIAGNILNSPEDEEECLSDTWLSAWNSIPPKRPKIFSVYLGKITRNLSLNIFKKRNAQKRGGYLSVSFDELSECIPARMSTEESAEHGELVSVLSSFIRTLKKTERFVFLRRYWYCDSIEQIAVSTGFSESKIKAMLFRSRKSLRSYLEKEGHSI